VVHKEVVYLKFSESYIVFGNEVRPNSKRKKKRQELIWLPLAV
jgi:hypothetical protein